MSRLCPRLQPRTACLFGAAGRAGRGRRRLCLTLLLAVVVAPGITAPADAATAEPAVQQLGQRLGECLGREDPVCIRGVLDAISAAAGAGFTLRFAEGSLALLEARHDEAAKLLGALAADESAPPVLRKRAAGLAAVAHASATITAKAKRVPIVDGSFEVWVEPGPDEILVPLLDAVLRRAAPALTKVFGPLPAAPIRVLIYARPSQLAETTGLTEAQIKTSGTIAVCKYNRLMVTSPRALVFGYPWADTVVHELIHLLVTRRGSDRVPVWLHEALARSHEGLWRGADPKALDLEERGLLDRARRRRAFVTLRQMSPSIAALPSQEKAQLAFAEVHHLLAWLLADERRTVAGLLGHFAAGQDEDAALAAWTGGTTARWQSNWWSALRRGAGYEAPPADAEPSLPLAFKGDAGKQETSHRGQRYVELGDRLLALERPLAAVLEYQRARAKGAPADVLMSTRLARALLAIGRLDDAAREVDRALARFPQHAPLVLVAGKVALAAGDAERALHHAEDALHLNPFDPGVHELGAAASEKLGRGDEAALWRARGRSAGR